MNTVDAYVMGGYSNAAGTTTVTAEQLAQFQKECRVQAATRKFASEAAKKKFVATCVRQKKAAAAKDIKAPVATMPINQPVGDARMPEIPSPSKGEDIVDETKAVKPESDMTNTYVKYGLVALGLIVIFKILR